MIFDKLGLFGPKSPATVSKPHQFDLDDDISEIEDDGDDRVISKVVRLVLKNIPIYLYNKAQELPKDRLSDIYLKKDRYDIQTLHHIEDVNRPEIFNFDPNEVVETDKQEIAINALLYPDGVTEKEAKLFPSQVA